MHNIMPKKVRGTHAFRTSRQSHGAATANPSLSKGKEKEMDIDGSDNEPAAITNPSTSTTAPIPIPSSVSASSFKCKHSALGENNTTVSDLRTSCGSGKWKQHSTTLDGVKESLDVISMSLRELASECKLCQLQIDAWADAGHKQGGKTESPQCRHEVLQHVQ